MSKAKAFKYKKTSPEGGINLLGYMVPGETVITDPTDEQLDVIEKSGYFDPVTVKAQPAQQAEPAKE